MNQKPKKEEAWKVPPQNKEAEVSILGAILLDRGALMKVKEVLEGEDFYFGAHRKIFEAMQELSEEGIPVDLVTLIERLQKKGQLEGVGGLTFVSSLVDNVPTTANVSFHAKIVKEKSVRRRIIETAQRITEDGFDATEDAEVLLDRAESAMFEIKKSRLRSSLVPIKEIVQASFADAIRRSENKEQSSGIATGFSEVDNYTSGLQPGDLVIIAGRPSMGKTAFALGVALHAAITDKKKVAFFSLEMPKEQVVTRMLCSEARVDAGRLKKGYLGKEDWGPLTKASSKITDAPIWIDDEAALSVLEIKTKARRLALTEGLDLVIVDYLQLMKGSGRYDNREREVSDISRSLKALAKELSVPVIVLSQLNRAVESRQDKQPQLSDIRESGSIEQDADVVMFVNRPDFYERSEEKKTGRAEIVFGKQRNGPTGVVELAYGSKFTRFDNLTK